MQPTLKAQSHQLLAKFDTIEVRDGCPGPQYTGKNTLAVSCLHIVSSTDFLYKVEKKGGGVRFGGVRFNSPRADEFCKSEKVASPDTKRVHNQHLQVHNFFRNPWNPYPSPESDSVEEVNPLE
ncbi:hypothetical protein PoB_003811300 [Plakobranchus ocellatus]|uniref:Uncharacterized protein n=1 Tax=Plakobranchus ocellatus TaxID=259542 RepID=A0AAV4AYN5_9GAST|nr:hypothetical protein PoB_003811300 [Plakobranchus ocellatus]